MNFHINAERNVVSYSLPGMFQCASKNLEHRNELSHFCWAADRETFQFLHIPVARKRSQSFLWFDTFMSTVLSFLWAFFVRAQLLSHTQLAFNSFYLTFNSSGAVFFAVHIRIENMEMSAVSTFHYFNVAEAQANIKPIWWKSCYFYIP